jgi:hypothetical protein
LLASQAKPRLPAAIADKSREELQVYVVELLKKLKLRDRKIEGELGTHTSIRAHR